MESFEFLGGRYNRPEQIMSGPVQAFRAQNAANGRTVFIHRVSTTEAPEEQATLLKLLTTALVKSADAKRLVLDFGEESGYWYVVTESEPQCALLREWLQLEIAAAAPHSRLDVSPATRPVTKAPSVPAPPSTQTDSGEFTRFLKARPSLSSPPSTSRYIPPTPPPPAPAAPPPPAALPKQDPKPEPSVGEFTSFFKGASPSPDSPPTGAPLTPPAPPVGQPAAPAPPAHVPAPRPDPGEFTSFFNTTEAERKQPKPFSSGTPQRPPIAEPPANAPPLPGPAQPEAGEFTRFFKPGLPPSPPKPAGSAPQTMSFERAQPKPFVQRPNTPVAPPPPTSKPADQGEFTQLFSRPENAKAPAAPPAANYQAPPAVRSDPFGFAKQPTGQPNDLSDDLFNNKIDIPKPLPSSQPQQSEFTRMFGTAGAAPPPMQQPSVVAAPRDKSFLDEPPATNDPLLTTQPMPVPNLQSQAPAGKEPTGSSPSEFTMIMQGGGSKPPAGAGAPPASGPAASGGSGSPLLNVNVAPINPLAALPHMGGGGVGGSVGGAHAHASAMGGASVGSALGSAHVAGPYMPHLKAPHANIKIPAPGMGGASGTNKKMVIFFIVLGVLAVLLLLLMSFLMKNK